MTTKNSLPSEFQVTLPLFEGPFSLLPLLVRKQELEIQYLPLLTVLDQFLNYLEDIQQFLRSNETSFLPHISWLHNCKSNSLMQSSLPKEPIGSLDETYDPIDCLSCIKEYSAIRSYTGNLQFLEEQQADSSYRPALQEEERIRPTDICTIEELKKALDRLIEESEENSYLIEKEGFTLSLACQEMKSLLKQGPLSFLSFCKKQELSRKSLIVFFLAILELLKQGEIFLTKQNDDIFLNHETR
jgi:segregation and condensation protein A